MRYRVTCADLGYDRVVQFVNVGGLIGPFVAVFEDENQQQPMSILSITGGLVGDAKSRLIVPFEPTADELSTLKKHWLGDSKVELAKL